MLLSQILNAGSLPAPVRVVEQRSVEPSLGKDAIQSGFRAIAFGGIGVLCFMLIYYMMCGLIANIALILNMLLLPLGMVVAAGFMGIFVSEGAGVQCAYSSILWTGEENDRSAKEYHRPEPLTAAVGSSLL